MEILKGSAPELIFNLVANQSKQYKGKSPTTFATVTELIRPAYEVALKRRFDHLVKVEALDLLKATIGTVIHAAVAGANGHVGQNRLQEERLSMEIDGLKITGAFDDYQVESDGLSIEHGVLRDIKYTSCWSYVFKKTMQTSWIPQLNCYAHLLRANNFPVDRMEVVAIFSDWSEMKAKDPSFPPAPAMEIPIFLWPAAETELYLKIRVALLKQALIEVDLYDVAKAPCTPDERWDKPTVYAVMKSGAKRSIKNCETVAEADKKIADLQAEPKKRGMYSMQGRPGERTKCLRYCAVRDICPENKAYRETLGGDPESTEE